MRLDLPESPDLEDALRLYRSAFPSDQRDSARNIKRWIRECRLIKDATEDFITERDLFLRQKRFPEPQGLAFADARDVVERIWREGRTFAADPIAFERYIRETVQQLEEYLWFDRDESGAACGLIFYQYYFRHRLAFVSYVVSTRPARTRQFLQHALLNVLLKNHPECEAILGEIENPHTIRGRLRRREALVRFRLLKHGWGIRILQGARYLQPPLTPDSEVPGLPLLLVYYPLSKCSGADLILTPAEYRRILDFIIGSVYADAYESQQARQEYTNCLHRLIDEFVETSSYPIRIE